MPRAQTVPAALPARPSASGCVPAEPAATAESATGGSQDLAACFRSTYRLSHHKHPGVLWQSAKNHNIDIYNARGVYSIPMAEYAVASVLQLYKNFTFFMIIKKINYGKKTDLCKNCMVKQFA